MNKEELIKLIDSLTIEEIKGLSISYYSEEEPSSYSSKTRNLKVMSFGDNINTKFENISRENERIYENVRRECISIVNEMLNSKNGH